MQTEIVITEEERAEFDEFKRQKRVDDAKAFVGKIECDLSSPTLEKEVLKRTLASATALKLGGVCVMPGLIKICKMVLGERHNTSLIALISHPHGGDTVKIKQKAIREAIKDGADEVEVTACLQNIKSGNWGLVKKELKKLKKAAKKKALRVNFQAPLLLSSELTKVCAIAAECGVNSVVIASLAYGTANEEGVVFTVKNAIKDRCQIIVYGAENASKINTLADIGVAKICIKNAVEAAQLIISAAENSGTYAPSNQKNTVQ
ncbi:MAG: hypothetical protein E7370_05725 [Clostridiales bacterium]|nr:hypothetical protein [Clostridiales bacterium]